MTLARNTVAGMLVALVVGAAAGGAIGGRMGYQAGVAAILNEALSFDARDVVSHVASLRALRSGERDKAIEGIETGMDDTLVMFDPETPFTDLRPETAAHLRKAIEEAKAYRLEYPHARQDSVRAKMVNSIFARELYK